MDSILVHLSIHRWLWLSAVAKVSFEKPKQIRFFLSENIYFFKKKLLRVISFVQNCEVYISQSKRVHFVKFLAFEDCQSEKQTFRWLLNNIDEFWFSTIKERRNTSQKCLRYLWRSVKFSCQIDGFFGGQKSAREIGFEFVTKISRRPSNRNSHKMYSFAKAEKVWKASSEFER